jgi:hypothetical protein
MRFDLQMCEDEILEQNLIPANAKCSPTELGDLGIPSREMLAKLVDIRKLMR